MKNPAPGGATTGTRIRERRAALGLKQGALARRVGISPSYLNLIEHNRRRIGGKLLADLAAELDVGISFLSEGAEAALLTGLRGAMSEFAAQSPQPPELDRMEEFIGRFPGWAALLDVLYRQTKRLEHLTDTLSDRLAHDPGLSAAMHEVLSNVSAIRSTADILAGPGEIAPNWQTRFHKNIQEEAHRLSGAARALVGYLDTVSDADRGRVSPQEEFENWLESRRYHVGELEQGGDVGAVVEALSPSSQAVRDRARAWLAAYRADAGHLPLPVIEAAIGAVGHDPLRLAGHLSADPGLVLRRLATLPESAPGWEIGRVACNASGMLVFRKPVPGFRLPRFGAGCPLWPLYRALMQPSVPVCAVLEQAGRRVARRFVAYAHAQAQVMGAADGPLVVEAQMVLIPAELLDPPGPVQVPAQVVGQSCRICPRADCAARRESSILAE